MSSNSRRVRSTDCVAREGLELVGPDLDLADRDRRRDRARLGALAAPHDGLHAGDQLLRVTRLGHPVVGAHAQPADALGHARLPGADDHAELRQPRAELLQVVPRLRPEHGEVDHDGVEPHGDQRVERDGRGQHAVLPAGGAEALGEDLQEPAVGIEDREADRGLRRGRHRATSIGATQRRGTTSSEVPVTVWSQALHPQGRSRIFGGWGIASRIPLRDHFADPGLTRVKRRRTRGRGP